ncbi:MAG: hypothetical protein DWP97_10150, partial [Calditrichaeota bacterium]
MKKLLLILFIILLCKAAFADSSFDTTVYSYNISIESVRLENFETDTISVYLNSPKSMLGGYDFKIAMPNSLYEIVEVIPGDFYNDCNWEFFNSRQVSFSDNTFDFTVWQVVAISELFADSVKPSCFSSEEKISLVDFVIRKKERELLQEMILPIFFLWEDCSDNTISGRNGTELYLSQTVMNFGELPEKLVENKFPTAKGVIPSCV